jgi:hypothetical protein
MKVRVFKFGASSGQSGGKRLKMIRFNKYAGKGSSSEIGLLVQSGLIPPVLMRRKNEKYK